MFTTEIEICSLSHVKVNMILFLVVKTTRAIKLNDTIITMIIEL